MSTYLYIVNPSDEPVFACVFDKATGNVLEPAAAEFEAWGAGGNAVADYDIVMTAYTGNVHLAAMPASTPKGGDYVAIFYTLSAGVGNPPITGDLANYVGMQNLDNYGNASNANISMTITEG